MKKDHEPNSKVLTLFRLVSLFLSGSIFGIAGFVYFADSAGILVPNHLFRILFPIGLATGTLIALLPSLIGEIWGGLRKRNSSFQAHDFDTEEPHGSQRDFKSVR